MRLIVQCSQFQEDMCGSGVRAPRKFNLGRIEWAVSFTPSPL